jgi:peptidyl-prolyl cis-trans isomerase D
MFNYLRRLELMVMQVLRKQMKIVIWIAVVSFIALIFLAWGMDVSRKGPRGMFAKGMAASINGNPIRVSVYREAINKALSNARDQSGGDVDGITSSLIEDQVFEQLVQEELLREEIAKRGISTSDQEIVSFMKNVPPQEFKKDTSLFTNGEFDMEKYKALFQNPANVSWLIQYEQYVRGALPKQKLMLTVYSTTRLTDLEVGDAFSRQNADLKLAYILASPERAGRNVEPTDADLQQYYNQNAQNFQLPMTARLAYVSFSTLPSLSDSEAAKQDIDEIWNELKAGAGFSELAKQVTQDASTAESGGLVGWVKRDQVVKPFEDAAFSLKPGQISAPLLSQYGWHVIRVDARAGDSVKVSHILVKVEPSDETVERARDAANLFLQDASKMDFQAAAVAQGVTVQETPRFTGKDGLVPGIGYSSFIKDFAFRSKPGTSSGLVTLRSGFYVLKLLDRKESYVPKFEEIADTIRVLARTDKRMALAKPLADSARVLIAKGKPMSQAASMLGLEYGVTREFSLMTAFPDYPVELIGAGSALKEGATSKPIKTDKGYYIIQVLKRAPLDKEKFTQVSSALASSLIQNKQRDVVNQWMTSLREKADIKDYRYEMNQ